MPITIKKQDGDIKFYGNHSEPILTIFDGEPAALLGYAEVRNIKDASEISEATMIAGMIVEAIRSSNDSNFKRNNIPVSYLNEGDASVEDTLYSHRKLLRWLESDKVVTVNKTKRIRYQFTRFAYQGKLIILYKPVAW